MEVIKRIDSCREMAGMESVLAQRTSHRSRDHVHPCRTMKLFAFPIGMPPNGGTASLLSQIGIGGILETFGGILILLGLFTRPAAFILAGEMAVAYFQFHFPQNVWPVVNGGISAVLYCFVWLYFSAAGAGPWSLDAKRKK